LSGIKAIRWDATGNKVELRSTDPGFDITNDKATLSIPGTNASLTGAPIEIEIEITGSDVLNPRTLNVTVEFNMDSGGPGLEANSRDLVTTTVLTIWNLNGTVLIANFQNGNTAVFASRIYIFNTGSQAGDISVRVFTLPPSGPSTQLGGASVDLGSLAELSGRNIKLAEDLLTPLGITLPYEANGGNLVVEVVIEAAGVTGVGQVFKVPSLDSFGIYPLSSIN